MSTSRPNYTISTSMFFEAFETLASHNSLDDRDPDLETAPLPAWAAQIRNAMSAALYSESGAAQISVTPDLADYTIQELHAAADAAADGKRIKAAPWKQFIAGAYSQYLSHAEPASTLAAFAKETEQVIQKHQLDVSKIPAFSDFRQQRSFSHLHALPTGLDDVASAAGVAGYCVIYPGDNILGYDPSSGEAWFQDYKGEFRGPIEEIERKLYLWAIVESPLADHAGSDAVSA